jgi:hypothetical protein
VVEIGSPPPPVVFLSFKGTGPLASGHFDQEVTAVWPVGNGGDPERLRRSLICFVLKRKSPGRAGALREQIVNPVQDL